MSHLAHELYALQLPEQVALSPTGELLATVLRTVDDTDDSYQRALHLVDVATGAVRRALRTWDVADLVWITDTTLAFARRHGSSSSLWHLDLGESAEPRRHADLPDDATLIRQAPDGARVAWSRRDRRTHTSAVLVATLPRNGPPQLGEACVVLEAAPRILSLAWSPDGQRLAAICTAEDGREGLEVTHLWSLDPTGAHPAVRVGPEDGYLDAVGFTASGDIVGVGRPDTTVGNAQLFLCTHDRPASWRVRAAGDRGIRHFTSLSKRTMLVGARERGPTALFTLDLDAPAAPPRRVTPEGMDVISISRPSSSGMVAAIVRTPDCYGGLALLDPSAGDLTPVGEWPVAELVGHPAPHRWTVNPSRTIDGWLLGDTGTGQRRPLVVDLHGGPHQAWTGCLDDAYLYQQELVRRGWLVALPNTSGSDGYGERHLRRVVGAWGVPDAAEVAALVEDMVADGLVDPQRIALVGYSYGGFLANVLTTHNLNPAATVAGGAPADLATLVEASAEGSYIALAELGARPTDDPALYRLLSPITSIAQIRTPTLLLHGEVDEIVPLDQARLWHEALRARGVTTELRVYGGADHDLIFTGRPSHRNDYNHRLVDWLVRHVSASARPDLGAQ